MSDLDAAAARAVEQSVFGALTPTGQAEILAGHWDVSVGPGHLFGGREQPEPYQTALIVSGLVRMYVESPEGRQVAVRYAGPGYFIGAATTVGGWKVVPVAAGVQAVTHARALYLDQRRLRAAARGDAAVAWALLVQMTQYQHDLLHLMTGTVFGSIRQRTVMHLLNMAVVGPEGALVAPVTQQTLADAVGTTRETVARALGELRRADLIATVPGGVMLRDAERLSAETRWTIDR